MRRKIVALSVMTLFFVLAFALTAYANDRPQVPDNYRESMDRTIANHQEFLLAQASARGELDALAKSELMAEAANRIERLLYLMMQEQSIMDEIASKRLGFTLPSIRSVTSPNEMTPVFWIGLSEEPTEEVIEFIMEFTGIPREMAIFGREHPDNGSFGNEPRTPEMIAADVYEEGTIEFHLLVARIRFIAWHYEMYGPGGPSSEGGFWSGEWHEWYYNEFGYRYEDVHGSDYEGRYETVEPLQVRELSMGRRIFVQPIAEFTLGHPGAFSSTTFFTALHRSGLSGNTVFTFPDMIEIGRTRWSAFSERFDVGFVDMLLGFTISHRVFNGLTITNFRGTPQVGQVVRSYRGLSGVQQGVIARLDSWFISDLGRTYADKILTHPVGLIQDGDSGAALVSISGGHLNVLGTLGGPVWINGRQYGGYSQARWYH